MHILLIRVHGQHNSHCGVASALGSVVWIAFSAVYLRVVVLLHIVLYHELLALLHDHLLIRVLSILVLHSLLMPVLTALEFASLVSYAVWSAHVHWRVWLLMVAGVHCSTQPSVD